MTGPEWKRGVEEQGWGRVCRGNQSKAATVSFRCRLEGFNLEKIIADRQDARGKVQAGVYYRKAKRHEEDEDDEDKVDDLSTSSDSDIDNKE